MDVFLPKVTDLTPYVCHRRHHCPHLSTKIYDKIEKPCLLSEYTENYPTYHSFLPRESFKPKLEYKRGSIPMEGLTTSR
jgi:hypothetical protein